MKPAFFAPLCTSFLFATSLLAASLEPTSGPTPIPVDPYANQPLRQPMAGPRPSVDSAGFFLGLNSGAFWLSDLSATSGSLRVDFKFKTEWGLTIPVGYDFGNGLSAFLTVGYYKSAYESKGPNNGPSVNSPGHVISSGLIAYLGDQSQSAQSGGDLSFVPIMFNTAYQVTFLEHAHWYAGAGIGIVREDAEFTHFDFPETDSIVFGALHGGVHQFGGMSGTSWEFAFQLFTGLSYDFSPNLTANIGYRFLDMGGGITVDGNSTGSYTGQSVEGGLTFKF